MLLHKFVRQLVFWKIWDKSEESINNVQNTLIPHHSSILLISICWMNDTHTHLLGINEVCGMPCCQSLYTTSLALTEPWKLLQKKIWSQQLKLGLKKFTKGKFWLSQKGIFEKQLTELVEDEDVETHDEDTAAVRVVNTKTFASVKTLHSGHSNPGWKLSNRKRSFLSCMT